MMCMGVGVVAVMCSTDDHCGGFIPDLSAPCQSVVIIISRPSSAIDSGPQHLFNLSLQRAPGPKDRHLIAPSVRAGRGGGYFPERRRCATTCAGPSGLKPMRVGSPPSRTRAL